MYDELRADLKQNPRDFAANYILGATAFQDKNFEIAEPALKVAAEVSPELPEPWLYLGLIRLDQERYSEAELALRKAIETTGANEDRNNYQIRRAHLALARILAKRGDTDQAQKEFQKTRELSGKGLEQSQQTVSTLMAEGGGSTDFGPVIAQLKKEKKPGLEGLNPTAPISDKNSSLQQQEEAKAEDAFLREILATSFNDLGTAEAQSGQFRLALEHFQQAEKWNANVPNLSRNIGLAAMKTQDYTQAASALSEHLIAHPDDNSARAALGISLYALGRFAEAAQTIAPLDELALQDPQLGYAWAVSLSKLGQLKESAQILARLDTTRMPPEMLLLVGQTWGDDQHYETAIELFHRALQLDPRLRQAHYDAGLAYLRSDQPQLAAKEFEAELALSPHDLDAKYNLAFTLLQQSKQASATKLLEEVTRANPKQAEAQYQLGKLLLGEGKIGAAIAHLEVAAQFAPDKDYIHYQLQNAYRKASRQQDAERELGLYKELRERAKQTTARPKQP